jgi:hypothetical protein
MADACTFNPPKEEFRCLDAADEKVIRRKNLGDDFGAVYIGEKGNASAASRHGATGSLSTL